MTFQGTALLQMASFAQTGIHGACAWPDRQWVPVWRSPLAQSPSGMPRAGQLSLRTIRTVVFTGRFVKLDGNRACWPCHSQRM